MNILIGTSGKTYKIVKFLGSNEDFNIHACNLNEDEYFLKIVKSPEKNSLLEKEEFFLQTLAEEALRLQASYEAETGNTDPLNNHFLFPGIIDSLTSESYENRKILVLSLAHIAQKRSELFPLEHITSRHKTQIDPRTSAWILGKLLKMLVFTHSAGFLVNKLEGDNILINSTKHFVAVFDWSQATLVNGSPSKEECASEISCITKEVIKVLGGNPLTGEIPSDEQLTDDSYKNFLTLLLNKKYSNAFEAHKDFYALVHSLWPREFHPYTTKFATIS